MGGRWTTRRRSQTRIEENHTDRHHEKVGYLATDSSGRNRRARYSIREHTTGRCSFLKFARTEFVAHNRTFSNPSEQIMQRRKARLGRLINPHERASVDRTPQSQSPLDHRGPDLAFVATSFRACTVDSIHEEVMHTPIRSEPQRRKALHILLEVEAST